MMTIVKALINMTMLVMVLALFAQIFIGVEYALNVMLLPDLVYLIWFILWLPAVFSATIILSQVILE